MNSFKTNETNIKLKKEMTKVSKDLVTATEEKEVAENEYVSFNNIICSWRNCMKWRRCAVEPSQAWTAWPPSTCSRKRPRKPPSRNSRR